MLLLGLPLGVFAGPDKRLCKSVTNFTNVTSVTFQAALAKAVL
jgi:hypothetical protein